MTSKLIISLDFELMWGMRDHSSVAQYGDAVMGGRHAIPEMLRLFSEYGVRATWATVGLLFARTRDEMLEFYPENRPEYENSKISSYPAILSEVGENEDEDPYHFGRSLVDLVAAQDGQEIATHTFSHYYCLEPGSTPAAFDADLKAALAISKAAGHEIESIVFPRNQYSADYISVCVANGIYAYRGQPDVFPYQPVPKGFENKVRRGLRLLDSAMPVVQRCSMDKKGLVEPSIDVTASHFLRPWKKSLPFLGTLQLRRILKDMRSTAMKGGNFHLWWHPHNFGRFPEENLRNLKAILKEYALLREQYAMESLNMSDIARRARQGASA